MTTARFGLDTNVLIYAHLPAFAEHLPVKAYLEGLARREDVLLAVTPGVLHELVHVVTDARRFEPPVSMAEATALARTYLDRSNAICLATTPEATARALDLVDRHRLGRKRLADALLAATYLEHGVARLVTCDPGGFGDFDGLELVDPRQEAG